MVNPAFLVKFCVADPAVVGEDVEVPPHFWNVYEVPAKVGDVFRIDRIVREVKKRGAQNCRLLGLSVVLIIDLSIVLIIDLCIVLIIGLSVVLIIDLCIVLIIGLSVVLIVDLNVVLIVNLSVFLIVDWSVVLIFDLGVSLIVNLSVVILNVVLNVGLSHRVYGRVSEGRKPFLKH